MVWITVNGHFWHQGCQCVASVWSAVYLVTMRVKTRSNLSDLICTFQRCFWALVYHLETAAAFRSSHKLFQLFRQSSHPFGHLVQSRWQRRCWSELHIFRLGGISCRPCMTTASLLSLHLDSGSLCTVSVIMYYMMTSHTMEQTAHFSVWGGISCRPCEGWVWLQHR